MARNAVRTFTNTAGWLLAGLIGLALLLPVTGRAADTIEAEIKRHTAKIARLNQKKRPISWAMTHLRLGRVLYLKGRQDNDLDILDQALAAFSGTEALWSEQRTPKKWSMVQYEKARVYEWRAKITDYDDNLDTALGLINTAMSKRPNDPKDHKRARLEMYQARLMINSGVDRLTGDALVRAGYESFEAVFSRYQPEPKSFDWNSVLIGHANAKRAFAFITSDKDLMQQAADSLKQAEDNARENRSNAQLNEARFQRGRTLTMLSWLKDDTAFALEAAALFELARPYYQARGNAARLAFLDGGYAYAIFLLAIDSPKTYSAKESLERLIRAERTLREMNRITAADEYARYIVYARKAVQKLGHW